MSSRVVLSPRSPSLTCKTELISICSPSLSARVCARMVLKSEIQKIHLPCNKVLEVPCHTRGHCHLKCRWLNCFQHTTRRCRSEHDLSTSFSQQPAAGCGFKACFTSQRAAVQTYSFMRHDLAEQKAPPLSKELQSIFRMLDQDTHGNEL